MKFIFSFFIGLVILIAGCGQGYELSKSAIYYGYDFTKYSAQGFLFTPETYNGEYESIGLIEAEIYPKVSRTRPSDDKSAFDTWTLGTSGTRWYVGSVSADEVLDSLYTYTKQMGADAVVRLEIGETESRSNGEITFKGVKASGFAIKRK